MLVMSSFFFIKPSNPNPLFYLARLSLLDKDRQGKKTNEPNILNPPCLSSSHVEVIRAGNKEIHMFREVVLVQVRAPLPIFLACTSMAAVVEERYSLPSILNIT